MGALVVVGIVVFLGDGDGDEVGSASDGALATTASGSGSSVAVKRAEPATVLDTRAGETTLDGQFAAVGAITPAAQLELPIGGRTGAGETSLIAATVTVIAGVEAGELSVAPCGGDARPTTVSAGAGSTTTRAVLVPLGDNDAICLASTAPVDVVVDVTAFLDPGAVQPLAGPVALVDTRPRASTIDGRFAAIGVRPEQSTLRVPVAGRLDGIGDAAAIVVGISRIDPLEPGALTAFAAGSPNAAVTVAYEAGVTSRSIEVVPVGPSGDVCVTTTGRTDLAVELLGVVPSSEMAVLEAVGECPGQTVFPDHRIVALYGTQRSARLGVLGEQDPAAAAIRLDEIAEPWRAGDRPVLPAFELIATLATGTPEARGDYNIRASPEFVQEYLDVARRHGYYLILDLQPGRSDFLTEAQYYDDFLRQPDVGLALDPEWRVEAPDRPEGGSIGRVEASEVNAVIDYLAAIVAEEDLPEKLLVLHQFQDRMVGNRELLVEQPGVALTIHMDGFGTRAEKLHTWDVVVVPAPLDMGLKLFYDEDVDLLGAPDVLGGLFQPVPGLITYQ